jgi:arylsulfatase A-like enzyme
VIQVAFRSIHWIFLLALGVVAIGADNRPNIVFVLADDMGAGDLSCYGGKVPTPNIDRLAREGTRFTQAYVAAPICSPSRAGLITGQYPGRWRITSYLQTRKGNAACEMADFLEPNAPSLPRELKGSGYRTAHIGKWHLGGGRDVTNAPPFAAYGYDVGIGTYESPEPHPDITGTNWIWSAHDKIKRWERTGWMVDRTLDFLKESNAAPSFVNLWLDDPHTPWVPSADAAEENGRRDTQPRLKGVLVELDRQIGRLMEGIRSLAADRETLVVFLSDNGPLPTFAQSRTIQLRGAKLSLYEGGVRVPMIAWWPGRVPAGKVNKKTVFSSLDFFPTFLDLAGVKEGAKGDGENMMKALLGEEPLRSGPIFWEYGRNTNSFAFPGDAKNRSPNVAMRDGNWKLLVKADGTGTELYDLDADVAEEKNLAEAQPDRARKMREAALRWRRSLP